MASTKRRKATPGSRSTTTRRTTTSEDLSRYRDLDGEQVMRTRGEIDTRVSDGQRLRDEIEARIESRMRNAPARDVLSHDTH